MTKKPVSGIISEKSETLERKKCVNCLRKIKIDYIQCPYCSGYYARLISPAEGISSNFYV